MTEYNRKTIIRPHVAPIEEGTICSIPDDAGLYLFDIETWDVAPNGNALLLEQYKNATLLDIMWLPSQLESEKKYIMTMEQVDKTAEIIIYHQ
jgi:hypothetical protein